MPARGGPRAPARGRAWPRQLSSLRYWTERHSASTHAACPGACFAPKRRQTPARTRVNPRHTPGCADPFPM